MRYLFLLLLITGSIVFFVTVVKPRYNALQAVKQEVSVSGTNLSTANKLSASRDALIATYNTISKTDLDNIKTLLPDSVDNIRLIIQINALAGKNGLSVLRNVDYKTDLPDKSATPTAPVPAAAQKPYGEFTISFQTSGEYKNFLSFLSDLEQNLRLVDVLSVDFATNQGGPQQNIGSMGYKVTLKTYWLKK